MLIVQLITDSHNTQTYVARKQSCVAKLGLATPIVTYLKLLNGKNDSGLLQGGCRGCDLRWGSGNLRLAGDALPSCSGCGNLQAHSIKSS